MFHKNACTSSVEIRYCSLYDVLILLIEVMCLVGKVAWLMASRAFSTYSSFGMFKSLPPDLDTFLKHFSYSFQTLIFL